MWVDSEETLDAAESLRQILRRLRPVADAYDDRGRIPGRTALSRGMQRLSLLELRRVAGDRLCDDDDLKPGNLDSRRIHVGRAAGRPAGHRQLLRRLLRHFHYPTELHLVLKCLRLRW